jgi:hypothetical protein
MITEPTAFTIKASESVLRLSSPNQRGEEGGEDEGGRREEKLKRRDKRRRGDQRRRLGMRERDT